MKVIFVAGPFTAKNAWLIEQNIRKAEQVALELWELGFAVICPHANSRFFFGAASEDNFLEGYKEILKRCDGIFLLEKGGNSDGTYEEVQLAIDFRIPVFSELETIKYYFEKIKLDPSSVKRFESLFRDEYQRG